jgi:hypothetical protein
MSISTRETKNAKQYPFLIVTFISIIITLGIASAYQSGGPASSMGHSVEEINWNDALPGDLYVTGDVGIGTTTPGGKLVVSQPGNMWNIILDNTGAGGGDWFITSSDSAHSAGGGKFLISRTSASLSSDLTIDSSGNVGIGTTSPGYLLEVAGDGRVTGDLYMDDGVIRQVSTITGRVSDGKLHLSSTGGARLYFNYGSGGDAAFYGGGTDSLVLFSSSGNVGIGTESPGERLDVNGSIVASGTICDSVGCIGSGGGSDTDWVENAGNVYRLTGNVGIGTASPVSRLHVKSSGTGTGVIGAEASDGSVLMTVSENPGGNSFLDLMDASGTAANRIHSAGVSYFMGGNIGIGTASPAALLEIEGNGDSSFILLDDTQGSYVDNVGIYNDGRSFRIRDESDDADLLTVRLDGADEGNIGIGTINPGSNRLEVVGGPIKATGGLIIQTVASQAEEDGMTKVAGQLWLRTDI